MSQQRFLHLPLKTTINTAIFWKLFPKKTIVPKKKSSLVDRPEFEWEGQKRPAGAWQTFFAKLQMMTLVTVPLDIYFTEAQIPVR